MLIDDCAGIDPFIDVDDRRTRHLHAVVEGVAHPVGARESGKERRVSVDDAPPEGFEHGGSEQTHEPREHDEVGGVMCGAVDECAVPVLARGVIGERNNVRGNPAIAREAQPGGVDVGDDGGDLHASKRPFLDCFKDRSKIAPRSGNEHEAREIVHVLTVAGPVPGARVGFGRRPCGTMEFVTSEPNHPQQDQPAFTPERQQAFSRALLLAATCMILAWGATLLPLPFSLLAGPAGIGALVFLVRLLIVAWPTPARRSASVTAAFGIPASIVVIGLALVSLVFYGPMTQYQECLDSALTNAAVSSCGKDLPGAILEWLHL